MKSYLGPKSLSNDSASADANQLEHKSGVALGNVVDIRRRTHRDCPVEPGTDNYTFNPDQIRDKIASLRFGAGSFVVGLTDREKLGLAVEIMEFQALEIDALRSELAGLRSGDPA